MQHPADITRDGKGTRHWILSAAECPALGARRIARLGLEMATPGYSRVRHLPAGSFIMAVCEGKGRILLDGAWQTAAAGTACMAPPRVMNSFEAGGVPWVFAWVRYEEPSPVHPVVNAGSPLRVKFPSTDLRRAIEGLRAEWEGGREAKLLHHWIEIIHGLVRRIAQPERVDEKLWRFWEDVAGNLSALWDLDRLASKFHSSKEHLRRLCLRQLGRSPMQHLTYMRMQRARELLEATGDKLEVVAEEVGYESALVFSRAFKRHAGCSPSEYRRGR